MTTLPFLEARLVDAPAGTEGAAVGDRLRLAASRCTACHRADFPRRDACAACLSPTTDIALSGGELRSFTSVLHPPPGGQVATPYHIGVVAFPEGVSVMGQLLVGSLDEAAIGDSVEVVATEVDGTITYGFRPA